MFSVKIMITHNLLMLQAMKRNSFHVNKRYMLYFYEKYNTGQIEYFAAWIICNDYADI